VRWAIEALQLNSEQAQTLVSWPLQTVFQPQIKRLTRKVAQGLVKDINKELYASIGISIL